MPPKIKRLEEGLGRRLLDRTPRLVRLSADGGAFLGPARTLVAAHQGAVGSFQIEQRSSTVRASHCGSQPRLSLAACGSGRPFRPALRLQRSAAGSRHRGRSTWGGRSVCRHCRRAT
jgi:DNA-binding transcriptional LysR family regulator